MLYDNKIKKIKLNTDELHINKLNLLLNMSILKKQNVI